MSSTLGEICTRDVVVVTRDHRVVDVARLMRDRHVGSVVVVDERPTGKTPTGVLTDRDIVVGLIAVDPTSLERAVVGDLTSGKLVTGHEDEDVSSALRRMRSHGVRRLPIVDHDGVLRGIVALDDVVDHVAEQFNCLADLLLDQREREQHARPRLGRSSAKT